MGRVFCLPIFSRRNKIKLEYQPGLSDDSHTETPVSRSPASHVTAEMETKSWLRNAAVDQEEEEVMVKHVAKVSGMDQEVSSSSCYEEHHEVCQEQAGTGGGAPVNNAPSDVREESEAEILAGHLSDPGFYCVEDLELAGSCATSDCSQRRMAGDSSIHGDEYDPPHQELGGAFTSGEDVAREPIASLAGGEYGVLSVDNESNLRGALTGGVVSDISCQGFLGEAFAAKEGGEVAEVTSEAEKVGVITWDDDNNSGMVLSRQDVVLEVVRRLDSIKDVARCQGVSKAWESCCKLELKIRLSQMPLQGTLLGRFWGEAFKLPQGTPLDGFQNPPPPMARLSGSPLVYMVVASHQDVVLLRCGNALLVGSPYRFPGRWKELPNPGALGCPAFFGFLTTGDGDLLVTVQISIVANIYSCGQGCWTLTRLPELEPLGVSTSIYSDDFVPFQDAVYMLSIKHPPAKPEPPGYDPMLDDFGLEIEDVQYTYGLMKFDLKEEALWTKVELSQEDGDKLGQLDEDDSGYSTRMYLLVLLGKLFIFGVQGKLSQDSDFESVVYKVYQVELENQGDKLVDVTSSYAALLRAARADTAVRFFGCCEADDVVCWTGFHRKGYEEQRFRVPFTAYSVVRDAPITSFRVGYIWNVHHHTGNGDAFSHFDALPWMTDSE